MSEKIAQQIKKFSRVKFYFIFVENIEKELA